MELIKAIIAGQASALKMAESMISQPILISQEKPVWVIALNHVTHVQSGQAQVSELPMIVSGKGVKQYQYDNVAPSPWTWQISGYIPGNSALEPTNLFTPIVQMNVDFLKKAYENGSRITFKDVDCRIYDNCVIESLSIESKSDAKNQRPFTMTLKQIIEITGESADIDVVEQSATPEEEQKLDNTVTEVKKKSELKILANTVQSKLSS